MIVRLKVNLLENSLGAFENAILLLILLFNEFHVGSILSYHGTSIEISYIKYSDYSRKDKHWNVSNERYIIILTAFVLRYCGTQKIHFK